MSEMFTRATNDPRREGVTTGKQPAMARLSRPTLDALGDLQQRTRGLSLDAIVYTLVISALAPGQGR